MAKSEVDRNIDLDETIRVGSRKAHSAAGFLPMTSILSSDLIEDKQQRFHSQVEPYQLSNEDDQKYLESVLDDEKRRHRRELCDVKEHY